MAMVEVLVAVPFGAAFLGRLQAVDPRLRVREAPPELRRWLREGPAADPETRARAEQQVSELLEPAEVFVGWPRLTPEVRARAPRLRWIQTVGAGVDLLDPAALGGITLTNASGVAAVAMAEWTIGVIIMFAKRFPLMLRRQQERVWDRGFPGVEIAGKTCGVVGMGAIGREVAVRARAMGMRVLAIRRSAVTRAPLDLGPVSRMEGAEADELLPPADLPYLLRESDYVVLAAPLTPETRGMIGARELATMKRSGVLINVGRGALVDEEALIAALRQGALGGAGLDVFTREPLPPESPLWGMDNVFVSPHFSSNGDRYADRCADIVCDNLRRYLDGEPLRNLVDPERGY